MEDDKFVTNVERSSRLAAIWIDGKHRRDLALVREAHDGELPVVADFRRLQLRRALHLVVEIARPFENADVERRLDRAVLRREDRGELRALFR